ncbi:expansin-A25 [Cinnamomum micranthum f. kanehirae]|uniref:Expansin-A25 n=1 Tax=Cinnamomum micranthum f. kanehirae TaxID=337451 RepID=A0A3S3LWM3_9MAGN|nr:expansin-A25 [Cinnamomum micranthum f. kanehirae]
MASKPIDDDDLILYILGGLDPEYSPFVTSITTRDTHIRLSDLHGLLLSEDIRVSDTALEQHNISINVSTKTSSTPTHGKSESRGRGQHQQNNRGRGRNQSYNRGPSNLQNQFNQGACRTPCQVCNRVGHTALQCYHRFNHAFVADNGPSPNAFYASQSYASPSYPNENWYPDSGATNHITPDLANLSMHSDYNGNDTVKVADVSGQTWELAHATFYGNDTGEETMQGACGYGNLFQQGYGLETTALSTALFDNGSTCGACFAIRCVNSKWCLPGNNIITVTATNFCPPNYTKTVDIWCNPPQKHFDLSLPMFRKLGEYQAGIIPVEYHRVPCIKQGGMRFELKGNPYWLLVLVYNVADAGDVKDVKIKGRNTGWMQMTRNWGQNWQTGVNLVGQGLSFQVTTSDGKMVESLDVAPANWQFGQNYEGKQI